LRSAARNRKHRLNAQAFQSANDAHRDFTAICHQDAGRMGPSTASSSADFMAVLTQDVHASVPIKFDQVTIACKHLDHHAIDAGREIEFITSSSFDDPKRRCPRGRDPRP